MSTAVSALLAKSANYREVLELCLCDAVPSLVQIRVTSWYSGAKDPSSAHIRFQTLVPVDALIGLNQAVEAVLASPKGIADQDGGAACGS